MSRKLAFFVTSMLVLALASGVSAYNPNGEALPSGATEQEVFYSADNGETWESIGLGKATQNARSWNSGPENGSCNKAYWDITFTSHASIAQWMEWSLATTRKDWRVLKPGTYASDSIDFTLKSNNAVVVSFDGFGDLEYLKPNPPSDTQHYIATYYSVGNSFEEANANGWLPAGALNELVYTFEDRDALHHGMQFKFWQRIDVEESNSSSEYENVGTIRLGITNLKFWVDPENGRFAEDQYGQPSPDEWVPETI